MSKLRLIVLASMFVATGAFAQGSSGGITTSTDPAKIAAIEKHAAELKARPTQDTQVKPAAKQSHSSKSSTKSGTKSGTKSSTKSKQTSAKPAAKKAS
jgi:hypothetical protein